MQISRKGLTTYLLYGLLMGLLVLIMEVTRYKFLVREIEIDVFAFIISVIFLGIGALIGRKFIRKKKEEFPKELDRKKIGLSGREMEVLHAMAEGLSNQEIAEKLSISLNTTKTHISRIYTKLNAKRRTEAIKKAQLLSESVS